MIVINWKTPKKQRPVLTSVVSYVKYITSKGVSISSLKLLFQTPDCSAFFHLFKESLSTSSFLPMQGFFTSLEVL